MRISLCMRISLHVVLQWSLQRSATLMVTDVHITLRCAFHSAYHGMCTFHSPFPFLGLRKFFRFVHIAARVHIILRFQFTFFLGLHFLGCSSLYSLRKSRAVSLLKTL